MKYRVLFVLGRLGCGKSALYHALERQISANVLQQSRPGHLVVVEFSRASYARAMQRFDPTTLENCLVVYMDADFDICRERNVARHELAIADSMDNHLVPREMMERRYRHHDDQAAFVHYTRHRSIPVVVVNNEAEGEEHLEREVAELFSDLFHRGEP